MLTLERLKSLLSYDPLSGLFTRIAPVRGVQVGSVAGSLKKGAKGNGGGYIVVNIDYRHYYAHRLAWLYVHGSWPSDDIDHADGNRANNKLKNLRAVDRSFNIFNQLNVRSDNKLGLTGVARAHQKVGYFATIHIKKKRIHLGTFPTAEEASAAYKIAKTQSMQDRA